MMIMDRPSDSSALAANSRAIRMRGLGRHAGDRRLPGRGERRGRRRRSRPASRPADPARADAVVGEHQVEDRGDQAVADPHHRDAAAHHVAGAVGGLEVGQQHLGGLRLDLRVAQRERRRRHPPGRDSTCPRRSRRSGSRSSRSAPPAGRWPRRAAPSSTRLRGSLL